MDEIYNKMNPWWENRSFDIGIKRSIYDELAGKSKKRRQIEIITGSRRSGKTTLLKQLVFEYLKGNDPRMVFYINLEDPILNAASISSHVRNFRAKFGHGADKKLFLFFDEVQESKDWETELKSVYDSEDVKMFVTGSTSHMISMRGGKLTGRQATTCLYPLDFNEYLKFKKTDISGAEAYLHISRLDEYLQEGGYPEKILLDPPDYMQNLMQDIITRDIIRYFKPRKDREVFGLFSLLCAALGTRVSYSRFKRVLGITVDTVKDYLGYFEMAYLVSALEKWSDSPNDRIYANRKIYLYDTGFKTALDAKKDAGAKAENVLYMYLQKKGGKMGYFAESDREVDFILETPDGPVPVESKYADEIEEKDLRLAGLRLYIKKFSPKKGFVITRSIEKEFKIENTAVIVMPLWKVLTGKTGIG
jgi:uncharacterized protein